MTRDITERKQAEDFLIKPFESTELLLHIWNLLETRYLHLHPHAMQAFLDLPHDILV